MSSRLHPVVVGGVGGGGTRVVSQILDALAFEMGPVSTPSLDNVLFTSLFTLPMVARAPATFAELDAFFVDREGWWKISRKRRPATALLPKSSNRSNVSSRKRWCRASRNPSGCPRRGSLPPNEGSRRDGTLSRTGRWLRDRGSPPGMEGAQHQGVCLPQIVRQFPDMKYIHVIRHGLDMAYSRNVNQVRSWDRSRHQGGRTPRSGLLPGILGQNKREDHFLRRRRAEAPLPACPVRRPGARACGVDLPLLRLSRRERRRREKQQVLRAIPSVPRSLGRYKEQELSKLNPSLVDRVRDFGFDVHDTPGARARIEAG